MIKIVLDTNVFISALFWKGAPYKIVQRVIKGEILNFTSPQILQEIREKILIKFELLLEKVKEFLEIIVFNSRIINPEEEVDIVGKDPKDNKIIECALEAKASFVISGDKHLLEIKKYEGIKIISPREFLSKIEE